MAWDDTKVALDDFTSADWNAMVADQKTRLKDLTVEENVGSDCTGSDGDTGRVLTLSNTELTSRVQVFIEGRLEAPSNMTVTHNATASTIEFNNRLFDSDNIVVYPFA